LLYTITKKQCREVASGVNVDPTVVGGLMPEKFYPSPKCSPVGLKAPGRHTLGFGPNF